MSLITLYSFAPGRVGRLVRRLRGPAPDAEGYDFGWSWGAMNGLWLAAMAIGALALGLQLELPRLWPLSFVVALVGVNCFVGGLILRTSKRADYASLPLVDLLRSREDLVLDAGCGAGRTTIALAKVLGEGRVVALDRFDAYYIDGGGSPLLERNLRIPGLTKPRGDQSGRHHRVTLSGLTLRCCGQRPCDRPPEG